MTPLATVDSQETLASIKNLTLHTDESALDVALGGAIIDGKLEETMAGAPELRLEVLDRDYKLLNSRIWDTRITAKLEGVTFVLVEVSVVDIDTLALLFEHRLVATMRKLSTYRSAARGTLTRAEFINAQLTEALKKIPFNFHCPALHTIEAVAGTLNSEGEDNAPRSMVAAGLKVKGVEASEPQLNQATLLLRACEATNAPAIVEVAIICAAIGESTLTAITTPNAYGYWGVLQGGSGQDGAAANFPNPRASEEMGRYFCTGGKGFQGGGAIHQAESGVTEPGLIATRVEASGEPASFYGQYEAEAKAIVRAYHAGGGAFTGKTIPTGTGSFTGTGATAAKQDVVKTARYEFTRGRPGEAEDVWTCCLRLAAEVNWHFFIVGADDIYFIDDDELVKVPPAYRVYSGANPERPATKGVVKLTFDAEVGRRTVVNKNKRQPKPSQAELIAHVGLFKGAPGTVIGMGGWGCADGDWLIESVERDLFLTEATMHLRTPQKAIPEPASTISTVPGVLEGTSEGLPAVVEAAKRAFAERGRYVYDEIRPIPPSLFPPPGSYPVITDCSGFVTLCFRAAGQTDPNGLGYATPAGKPPGTCEGNTGMLIAHAQKISNPVPGCVLFFGSNPAYPQHVVLYIGDQNGIGMEAPGVNLQEGNAIGLGADAGPLLGYFRLGS